MEDLFLYLGYFTSENTLNFTILLAIIIYLITFIKCLELPIKERMKKSFLFSLLCVLLPISILLESLLTGFLSVVMNFEYSLILTLFKTKPLSLFYVINPFALELLRVVFIFSLKKSRTIGISVRQIFLKHKSKISKEEFDDLKINTLSVLALSSAYTFYSNVSELYIRGFLHTNFTVDHTGVMYFQYLFYIKMFFLAILMIICLILIDSLGSNKCKQ